MFGECHAHVLMNGTNYRQAVLQHREKPDEAAVRACLEKYQEAEVHFVRDGGDPYGVSKLAARLAPEYGIDYRTPIFAVHKNGHYGSIVGRGFDNLKEFHQRVVEAKKEGADFIKIMTTGLLDFRDHGKVTGTPLDAEEVREMVHIAHEEGFAVMSHTNGVYGVKAAIEAGVDSLEHGNYMDEEAISMLADSHTVWVPTLVTVRNLIGAGRFEDAVLRPIIRQAEKMVSLAYQKKAKVAVGSDAGAYMVPHGTAVRQEYEAFCQILGNTTEVKDWLYSGEQEIRERFRRK
ncbi:amidohydrolase family protein [Blautia sp. MSJ-19]|uniref:amidohydrolase family protein n=1 Tax=Blautia sp. MSJ-19 TaxID=2841517 RepID=UPI001C0F2EEB|nr:amidohydrolase family protein [Blautia sp. MSJ-19]MBU5482436.1 amidohydrolase family protein [Blautia sp. MSJ-19]